MVLWIVWMSGRENDMATAAPAVRCCLREIGENREKLGIENVGNNIIKKTLKVCFFYSSMCSSLVMFLCVPATDNNTSMSQHLSEELASGCGKWWQRSSAYGAGFEIQMSFTMGERLVWHGKQFTTSFFFWKNFNNFHNATISFRSRIKVSPSLRWEEMMTMKCSWRKEAMTSQNKLWELIAHLMNLLINKFNVRNTWK